MVMQMIILLLLAVFQVTVTDYLITNPDFYQLDAYTWESDEFRAMKLGEVICTQTEWNLETLTAWMIEHEYDLTDLKIQKGEDIASEDILADYLNRRRGPEYRKLLGTYRIIFQDLEYFPIPLSTKEDTPSVTYEDSWNAPRSYGGERTHEGCDIMGSQRPRGYYPVISMSDGVVEKIGWLEQGGWRIGIRTPSGLYLYYAHLYEYSRSFQPGDLVQAGELLGFMGDSGYSAVEGTVGNFDVHLHLGMYLQTDHYREMSINPYWILRYLEKYRLKYSY